MDNNEKEREKKIYDCLIKMKKGTNEEKSLAFDCIGILGNESLNINLNDKLTIVENKLKNYNTKIKIKDK